MVSDNPFVQKLGPDAGPFDEYDDIPAEDKEKYPLQQVSLRFTSPEKLTYLDHPVRYLAFNVNDDHKVTALLLFLDEHSTMLGDLEEAFGPADLLVDLDGEGQSSAGPQALQFKSYTWVKAQYTMSFSLYNHGSDKNPDLKSRIWIMDRG